MQNILVINGPNLNLLGTREPEIYGHQSLDEIMSNLKAQASDLGIELTDVQSNAEHELVNHIQAAQDSIDLILINPAAFTHTSIACRDALLAVNIPFIEVHLSNVDAREPFRRHSYFSDAALGKISGFGAYSYTLALLAANHYLTQQHQG